MAITVHLSSAPDRPPTPSPSHISIKLQIVIMPPIGELGSINFSSVFAPIQGGQIPFGQRQQISFPASGLTIWETYACALAVMGFFIDRDTIQLPIKSTIAKLPAEKFEKLFAFVAEDIGPLKRRLKNAQKYNESFPYALNPLRARPIVNVAGVNNDLAICPVPTLLYWRITSGLFYDLMAEPTFANFFGDSFQNYVGEVARQAAPKLNLLQIHCDWK
jgi:hypothetical protein